MFKMPTTTLSASFQGPQRFPARRILEWWASCSRGLLQVCQNDNALDETQRCYVSILSGVDVSGLIGAGILVGKVRSAHEILVAQRYREI